ALAAASAGCGSFVRPSTALSPAREWPAALADAQARASHGDFDAADSVLAAFSSKDPGTPETLETAYWRAVYKMDPTNRNASVTTAMATLDAYLADPRPRAHTAEASK